MEDPAPPADGHMVDQDSGDEIVDEDAEEETVIPPDSPHQYARFFGLVGNSLRENPFDSECIPFPPNTAEDDLEDPPQVLNIAALASLSVLAGKTCHERWDVDRDTAGFLLAALAPSKDDGDALNICDSIVTYRDLKLDLPVLHLDHETEMLKLRNRNKVRLSTCGMQPFAVDDENDEGVLWPSRYLNLHIEKDQEIRSEKLEVATETVRYIKAVVSPEELSDEELAQIVLASDRPVIVRPFTPPLMPPTAPFDPASPPSAAMEMELTSTPEDLIAQEHVRIDCQVLERINTSTLGGTAQSAAEASASDVEDMHDIYSPFKPPVQSSSSSPLQRKRFADFKMDVPLTPHRSEESPPKRAKTGTFPDEISTLIPLPDSDFSIMNPEVAQQNFDAFINDVVAPLAKSAIQQTENEQLVEIDTTMRVKVPYIDEVRSIPPWKVFACDVVHGNELNSQRGLLSYTKKELLKNQSSWSGVSKLERLLPWSLFPARLGKVKLDEDFDDGSLPRYMAGLNFDDEPNSDALVWKPEGLRLLDQQDTDDDHLEPAVFDDDEEDEVVDMNSEPLAALQGQPLASSRDETSEILPLIQPTETALKSATSLGPVRLDMAALLRKRQLELEAESNGTQAVAQSRTAEYRRRRQSLLQPGGVYDQAAGGGLSSFLHLQGQLSPTPMKTEDHNAPLQVQAAPTTLILPSAEFDPRNVERMERPGTILPTPEVDVVDGATIPIIVSSEFMTNRQLIRQVQLSIPRMEIIERDLTVLSGPPSSKSSRPGNAGEADITVSPSTALVLSTLQKLKQKPLPGQSSHFGIQERIVSVAERYERLIVLVSEGRQTLQDGVPATQPLDERDSTALTDFIGFAAPLQADVQILYIAGGDSELARWIAAAIAHYAIFDGGHKLLQEETLWERFLRKAGMNAFAAQVVLVKLKAPEMEPEGERSSSSILASSRCVYGLAAFVAMTVDERIQCFGPLLGGDRVLRRISNAIDGG